MLLGDQTTRWGAKGPFCAVMSLQGGLWHGWHYMSSPRFGVDAHETQNPGPPSAALSRLLCPPLPPLPPLSSQLPLSGEASSIRFAVEPQFFDLGLTPYDRPVERELHVANTGGWYWGLPPAGASSCFA